MTTLHHSPSETIHSSLCECVPVIDHVYVQQRLHGSLSLIYECRADLQMMLKLAGRNQQFQLILLITWLQRLAWDRFNESL